MKAVLCLYNKQNNTWALGDMKFISSCSNQYRTSERSERVKYRFENSKINSISPRAHVLFSIRTSLDQLELTSFSSNRLQEQTNRDLACNFSRAFHRLQI